MKCPSTAVDCPGGSVKNPLAMLEMQEMCGRRGLYPWGQGNPLEEEMATFSTIPAWKILKREAWRAIVHGDHKEEHDWATLPCCRLSCLVVKLFCGVFTRGQHFLVPHSDNLPCSVAQSCSTLCNHWSFYCLHSFAFPRVSNNWNHTVYGFLKLSFFI